MWPLEGDHSLESMEVTRNWLLAPEQGEPGPPPEDLKSEEGLPVKTQWMTSWTSYPQVGKGPNPYGGVFLHQPNHPSQ